MQVKKSDNCFIVVIRGVKLISVVASEIRTVQRQLRDKSYVMNASLLRAWRINCQKKVKFETSRESLKKFFYPASRRNYLEKITEKYSRTDGDASLEKSVGGQKKKDDTRRVTLMKFEHPVSKSVGEIFFFGIV